MSRTKRNNRYGEITRSAHPYRRQRIKLSEFEIEYIARNQNARIEL